MTTGTPDADLKGNTLRVYTYLFKVQRSGIREAQRSLGIQECSRADTTWTNWWHSPRQQGLVWRIPVARE